MIRPVNHDQPRKYTEFEEANPQLIARIGRVSVAGGDQGLYLEMPGHWR